MTSIPTRPVSPSRNYFFFSKTIPALFVEVAVDVCLESREMNGRTESARESRDLLVKCKILFQWADNSSNIVCDYSSPAISDKNLNR